MPTAYIRCDTTTGTGVRFILMKLQPPSYYRARIKAIRQMIFSYQKGTASKYNAIKNSPEELLKNGVIRPSIKEEFDDILNRTIATCGNSPLSFEEITSFNTWFEMHPQKIAGVESVTSSLYFPVTIQGTKEDIISIVTKELQNGVSSKVRLARVKASAKLKILQLVKL